MQSKPTRRKTVQDDIETLKRRRDDRKMKEDKKGYMPYNENLNENTGKLMDKDYLKMIRNKKADIYEYEPEPHVGVGNSKIFVVVRKRPLSNKEILNGEIDCVSCLNPKITIHECKIKIDGITKYLEDHEFYFDNTFAENESTQEIYDCTVGPMIDIVLNKGIVTCFAYGQTGSGKTYTMKGIQNLAINSLFEECANIKIKLEFYISFFEIYGGRVYDLLNNKNKLQVLDDQNGKTQIYGLQEILAETPEEMRLIIDNGNAIRTTHNTVTNATSSRSHAICNITIREKNKKNKLYGKLSLVDLAGSERAQETQSNNRQRRAEGAEINKSLLALKECIRALQARKNSGNNDIHVPFRASKLTHVLRDSFMSKNDKSKIIMISCVNPSYISSNHTINTLRYSDRLKEQTAYMKKQLLNNKNVAPAQKMSSNNNNQIYGSQNNNNAYRKNGNININNVNNNNGINIPKNKIDREKELEEINLNVFNSKDDILNDINFDDKINLAEDILGFNNDLNMNLNEDLINGNINLNNNNISEKELLKDLLKEKIKSNEQQQQIINNNNSNNNSISNEDGDNEDNDIHNNNIEDDIENENDIKEIDDMNDNIGTPTKENDKDKEINEELEDLLYLKKTVSKDGKFISDDFIKYHKLTDKLIEEEDDIVATHMEVVKQDAKMLTEEGELISKIKGIGDNDDNFNMDIYLKRLEKIIDKKIDIYTRLQNKIDIYKQHIKDEEQMRKEHPQFFVDPADI